MAGAARLQDLPPKAAALALRVEDFLTAELAQDLTGATLLLGLSGGADSTALLHLLAVLAPRLGFTLQAAHLDHGLRPESAADASFCAQRCADMGVSLYQTRVDVAALAAAEGLGLEAAGRQARYGWFGRLLENVPSPAWVCTAHTLDDLAEDQLLRLTRGAGWPALGGMPAVDASRRLLRPLLTVPKARLLAFLGAIVATWVEDESNVSLRFARNRVRHELLPLLRRENPGYLSAALRLWRQANLDRELLDQLVPVAQPQADGSLLLPAAVLAGLPAALRLRACKAALERLDRENAAGQLRFELLWALDKAWLARVGGKAVQFPGGRLATVQRLGIMFQRTKCARQ